jgi:hypothetical protein
LPHTFTWSKRSITTDYYEFILADISDYDPEWWTDVGYAANYILNGVPMGFVPGEQYVWWINVYGPDGYGTPYYGRHVTFSNAGAALQGGSLPAAHPNWDDDEAGMHPQVR